MRRRSSFNDISGIGIKATLPAKFFLRLFFYPKLSYRRPSPARATALLHGIPGHRNRNRTHAHGSDSYTPIPREGVALSQSYGSPLAGCQTDLPYKSGNTGHSQPKDAVGLPPATLRWHRVRALPKAADGNNVSGSQCLAPLRRRL